MKKGVIDSYKFISDGIPISVEIRRTEEHFAPVYFMKIPRFEKATTAFLDSIRDRLIVLVPIKLEFFRDKDKIIEVRNKIKSKAAQLIKEGLKDVPENILAYLTVYLANEMLGLGNLQFLIDDEQLEEIVVNSSKEPVWVYHRKYGWLVTNLYIPSEEKIVNYASLIGRRVGRQITVLTPLMDAHLLTGDRVNATLFPISTSGNTITIRKFRRKPWTITDLLMNGTLNYEIASFLWLAVQYELSMIISGGTASGKTTLLNVLMPFIPPNERIITIEQTRELSLPKFLHWVPLTTRDPNPEGKGEVSMLDLLVNSLRMRPDRIIVGEVRRKEEAEVLFEALNTGHSVYATFHANTAEEAFRRLTTPPIELPKELVATLPLFAVVFRQRKLKIRRLFEVAEVIQSEKEEPSLSTIYRWIARKDQFRKIRNAVRTSYELQMFTGMNDKEMEKDLKEKQEILKWMVKNKINTVNTVGKVVSEYYLDPETFLKNMKSKNSVSAILREYESELKNEKK